MPFRASLHFYFENIFGDKTIRIVSMPFRAFLHFYSILLEPAEIKHFPGLFCRYLSENSENNGFQIISCIVHNLFIFKCKLPLLIRPLFFFIILRFFCCIKLLFIQSHKKIIMIDLPIALNCFASSSFLPEKL